MRRQRLCGALDPPLRHDQRDAGDLSTRHREAVSSKAEGVDVLAYLTWALERVHACNDRVVLAAKLTPAAYKEAQKARDG